jgi:hypothetical protein
MKALLQTQSYLDISFISREPSSASTMCHSLTIPSLDPEASMSGRLGQKCTDQTIRLCAESDATSSSKSGPFIVLFQMQILRSLPDEAWMGNCAKD